ncbi:MAG TPA: hypothetical protein DHT43_00870 [Deltaproteobacteria bacterium]|nr:hypothetical protein [Deltaproteobacteria bacterium]
MNMRKALNDAIDKAKGETKMKTVVYKVWAEIEKVTDDEKFENMDDLPTLLYENSSLKKAREFLDNLDTMLSNGKGQDL